MSGFIMFNIDLDLNEPPMKVSPARQAGHEFGRSVDAVPAVDAFERLVDRTAEGDGDER